MSSPSMQPQSQRSTSGRTQESYQTEEWRREQERRYRAWEEEDRRAREQRIAAIQAQHSQSFAIWCFERVGAELKDMDQIEKALAFTRYRSSLEEAATGETVAALKRLENELESEHCTPQLSASSHKAESTSITAMMQSVLRWTFGPIAALLKNVRVLETALALPTAAKAKYQEVVSFLRRSRTCKPPLSKKAAFSVYQAEGKTILHATRSDGRAVLLELSAPITDSSIVEKLIGKLHKVFATVTKDADPIAVVDGAMPAINFKKLYPEKVVVRSIREATAGLEGKIKRLYSQEPLTRQNTSILSAIPQGEVEAAAVFQAQEGEGPVSRAEIEAHAQAWDGVKAQWATSTANNGFAVQEATKSRFLESVSQSANVLVLVAHANSQRLRFPDGSFVTHEDVRAVSDRIRANGPTIYLYCCEAAAVDGLENWASVLLDAGATAVIAPQGKVDPVRSRKLFARFLKYGSREMPIQALRRAESRTRQRYLENWVG